MGRYTHTKEPASCIGVDFGAGSLVIGIALPDGSGYRTLEFPHWSQEMPGTGTAERIHRVPALVHYSETGELAIGDEVMRAGTVAHAATARWIRTYLLEESTAQIPAGMDHRVTFRDAAADFLNAILARTVLEYPGIRSIVFSIPAGAPSWYAGWLGTIAHAAGIPACRMTNELTAVSTGYDLAVAEGQSFVLVHFDETELVISVIRNDGSGDPGRGRPEVAGSAREDTGCRVLDGWIAQDIVARSGVKYTGTRAQKLYDAALTGIRDVYSQLARADETSIGFTDPASARTITVRVTREDIGQILTGHGLPDILDRTLERARAAAHARRYTEDVPIAVLMTGRGTAIPAVQALVQERFPGVSVRGNRPFDAIARGAVLTAPPTATEDRILNNYALQYWDPAAREHRYRFLVRNGARFPSDGQVARITISAAYDGQTRLGIPLYEISTTPEVASPALELVSDPSGGVRLAGLPDDAAAGIRPVLVNGRTPTLLAADPPALKGEPRFELTFMLDREKNLCVTARDLATGMLVKKNAPIHRLI
ncbi:MAG: Hsp70 family protein [Methanoregula sp.]